MPTHAINDAISSKLTYLDNIARYSREPRNSTYLHLDDNSAGAGPRRLRASAAHQMTPRQSAGNDARLRISVDPNGAARKPVRPHHCGQIGIARPPIFKPYRPAALLPTRPGAAGAGAPARVAARRREISRRARGIALAVSPIRHRMTARPSPQSAFSIGIWRESGRRRATSAQAMIDMAVARNGRRGATRRGNLCGGGGDSDNA